LHDVAGCDATAQTSQALPRLFFAGLRLAVYWLTLQFGQLCESLALPLIPVLARIELSPVPGFTFLLGGCLLGFPPLPLCLFPLFSHEFFHETLVVWRSAHWLKPPLLFLLLWYAVSEPVDAHI